MNTVRTALIQYISIFVGCLQYIASDAYRSGNVETGGGLYGLWSHALRPVIMLATPSGPGACNERTHFAIDPDYVTKVNEYLQGRFGIQYLGNWHDHHDLGLDYPSQGDINQIHGVAARHGIPRMVQIIITRDRGMTQDPRSRRFTPSCHEASCDPMKSKARGMRRHSRRFPIDYPRMKMNTFVYRDAAQGPCERCGVKSLDGQSPIRSVLAGSDILASPGDSCFDEYPPERIICDEVESSNQSAGSERALPSALLRQLNELPDRVVDQTELYRDEGLLSLSLPLSQGGRLGIVYQIKRTPPRIHSVRLMSTDPALSEDVTPEVLMNDHYISLSAIWQRIQRFAAPGRGGTSGLPV